MSFTTSWPGFEPPSRLGGHYASLNGIAGTASCDVRPAGGVTKDVQAELISRAQTARHVH